MKISCDLSGPTIASISMYDKTTLRILLSLYSIMKSEPTKKSFYLSKSGNSSVRLFNEVFTNSTIVKDMLNYVVNFLNIRSLESCWSGKWSIRAMNALYKLFDVVKSNSFMYELNDFYIKNFNSFIVDAGRLQS